jgi:hypothetical protein
MTVIQTDIAGSEERSNRAAMIDSLASMPRKIDRIVGDIDAEKACRLPAHDQWCIVEILVHLGDVEARYRERLGRIVSEENLHVPAIWPRPMPGPLPSFHDSLAIFQQERTKTIAFLSALTQEAWRREVHHATLGPSTLLKQVQGLIDHDEDHFQQMAETRKLVGA